MFRDSLRKLGNAWVVSLEKFCRLQVCFSLFVFHLLSEGGTWITIFFLLKQTSEYEEKTNPAKLLDLVI